MATSAKNPPRGGRKAAPRGGRGQAQDGGQPGPQAGQGAGAGQRSDADFDTLAGTDPRDGSPEAVEKRQAAMAAYLRQNRLNANLRIRDAIANMVPVYIRFADPNNPDRAQNVALNPDEGDDIAAAAEEVLQARLG